MNENRERFHETPFLMALQKATQVNPPRLHSDKIQDTRYTKRCMSHKILFIHPARRKCNLPRSVFIMPSKNKRAAGVRRRGRRAE